MTSQGYVVVRVAKVLNLRRGPVRGGRIRKCHSESGGVSQCKEMR